MAGTVGENLAAVMERIEKAAKRAGRDPGEITLVVATKSREPREIRRAIAAGARVFGENYVQEAQEKIPKIRRSSVRWHLIGHLQKNKVKFAVELFDMIESVDSAGLAKEINKRAKAPMDVLIEVNLGGEASKHGVHPSEAVELAREIASFENLRLRGLMAIPPQPEDPEMSRPYFVTLRRIAERINREKIPGVVLKDLSMGMSADFEVAIEEGATIVRIGTAIFGERPPKGGSASRGRA
ncbi:MAG TPA: YggS family pyridoxal phosphate-dependent enzyme [Deltaproteobacteria bacterium]|nr:YggS family pyridoxal phosphate-dependent enzyme [Deltaproteobacteria bacterium]